MKRSPAAADASEAADDPAVAARRAEIERVSVALGKTWATHLRHALAREGRVASGGWPGTLREARAHVGLRIRNLGEGRSRGLAITEAEREIAARAVYSSAREEWLHHAEPEPA